VGTPGISTEKRPFSEINFVQPELSLGVFVEFAVPGGTPGGLECSCPLTEKPVPRMISETASKILILNIPSVPLEIKAREL
jgi:hypothetical protein